MKRKILYLLKIVVNVTEFNTAVHPRKMSLGCQIMISQEGNLREISLTLHPKQTCYSVI